MALYLTSRRPCSLIFLLSLSPYVSQYSNLEVTLKLNKQLDDLSPMSKTTSTKPSKPTEETFTVDVDLEKQTAKITSAKHKTDFTVAKLRSAMFFSVYSKSLPKDLSGKYTSLESAIQAVTNYIRNSKESFGVRSDRLHEERQQRKHAES